MFLNLPYEIINIIYEYDSAFKELYDLVINEIKLFPKFNSYDNDFKVYFFGITKYKGIYMYSSIDGINYKQAFLKANSNYNLSTKKKIEL